MLMRSGIWRTESIGLVMTARAALRLRSFPITLSDNSSCSSPRWVQFEYRALVVAAQTHGHRWTAKQNLWYSLSQILSLEVCDEEVAEHAGPNPSPRSRSCRRGRARSGRGRSDGWSLEQGEVDIDPGQRGVRDHDGELDHCGP